MKSLKQFDENIWIRYLLKKGILSTEGLTSYEHNEEEMKEFESMLRRLLNSTNKEKAK